MPISSDVGGCLMVRRVGFLRRRGWRGAIGLLLALSGATPAIGEPAERDPPKLAELIETRAIDSISVSPDQQRVAFRVLRPSVRDNAVEAIWYSLSLVGKRDIRQLGTHGVPRWLPFFDAPIEEQPVWTADGRHILVLETSREGAQVHLLGVDGFDRDLTRDPANVERFAISGDGKQIEYWTRDARAAIAAADARVTRDGLHFDRTVMTDGLPLRRNFFDGTEWTTLRRMDDRSYRSANSGDLRRRMVALPSAMQAATAHPPQGLSLLDLTQDDPVGRRLPLGRMKAGVLPYVDAGGRMSPAYQLSRFDQANERRCTDPRCVGNSGELRLIATGPDDRVYFLREDDGSARSKIYRWNPDTDDIRLVLDAHGSLNGGSETLGRSCAGAAGRLICVHAAPASAPALVAIDPASGTMTTLFDPNPLLRERAYPETRYMEWRDSHGRSTTGILTLPARRGGQLPLVITTYRCRGYLRGGTAQVAPEFTLAGSGFAVLCANSNSANNDLPPETPGDDVLKMHKADIESYRAAIDILDEQGLVDRNRVGIAGHSYSANVISYAVSHTDLFRAAVIGSGISIDSATWWVTAPTADAWRRHDVLDLVHLPRPTDDPTGIWKKTAPSLNADAIHAAVLFQPPENEYLMVTQLFAAIQDSGGATDMYVYPGAGHMLGRFPDQLLVRAQRSVDWFRFWLLDDVERERLATSYPAWRKLLEARHGPFQATAVSGAAVDAACPGFHVAQ